MMKNFKEIYGNAKDIMKKYVVIPAFVSALSVSQLFIPNAVKKAEAANLFVYGNTTINSEKELNDEHKQKFTNSKDIPTFSYGFGLETMLGKTLKFGAGFNYNLKKKVDSVDSNDDIVGSLERQDIGIYGLLKYRIYKNKKFKLGTLIKPGINLSQRIQNINDETINEKATVFSLPIGAYGSIGPIEVQVLYDPLIKESKINLGGTIKF